MSENFPSVELPLPTVSRGLGCLARAFLVVVLLLILFGGLGWYTMLKFAPFLGQQLVRVQIFPATDAQYEEVTDKVVSFAREANAGHAAMLALTADDLNILIARDPSYAILRGKIYVSIDHNSLSTETAVLVNEDAPESQKLYFRGRAVFDASFTHGEFALAVRRVEPLDRGPTPSLVAWFVNQEGFSRGISHEVNETFQAVLRGNPAASALFDRVSTIIIKDNQLVVTALEPPRPVAAPDVSR